MSSLPVNYFLFYIKTKVKQKENSAYTVFSSSSAHSRYSASSSSSDLFSIVPFLSFLFLLVKLKLRVSYRHVDTLMCTYKDYNKIMLCFFFYLGVSHQVKRFYLYKYLSSRIIIILFSVNNKFCKK